MNPLIVYKGNFKKAEKALITDKNRYSEWLREMGDLLTNLSQPGDSMDRIIVGKVQEFISKSRDLLKWLVEQALKNPMSVIPEEMTDEFIHYISVVSHTTYLSDETLDMSKGRFINMMEEFLYFAKAIIEEKDEDFEAKFDHFMQMTKWKPHGVIDETQYWPDKYSSSALVRYCFKRGIPLQNMKTYVAKLIAESKHEELRPILMWCRGEFVESLKHDAPQVREYRKMKAAETKRMKKEMVFFLLSVDIYDTIGCKIWWRIMKPQDRKTALKFVCDTQEKFAYAQLKGLAHKNSSKDIVDIIIFLLQEADSLQTAALITGKMFLRLIMHMWMRLEYHKKIPKTLHYLYPFLNQNQFGELLKYLDETKGLGTPYRWQRIVLLKQILDSVPFHFIPNTDVVERIRTDFLDLYMNHIKDDPMFVY